MNGTIRPDADVDLQNPDSAPAPDRDVPFLWLANPAVHIFLILLMGFVAYSNTFQTPFLFDDQSSIIENDVIKNLQNFLGGTTYANNPKRFIGYLTFALNYHFGGLDVFGYHVVNLAIHLTSASLLYWFVRLILQTPFFRESGTGNRENPSPFTLHNSLLPLFTALLFVIHPVQTQAVTYIVQRLASLVALFYLLTLVSYLKARACNITTGKLLTLPGIGWYALAITSTALALHTKENAFTLPLIVLLIEFSFFRSGLIKKLIVAATAATFSLIVFFVVIKSGMPIGAWLSDLSKRLTAAPNLSRSEYLFTQFRVITTYIRLFFFPVGQNLDYDYPLSHSLSEPQTLISFLFLLALLGFAIFLYFRSVRGARSRETLTPLSTDNSATFNLLNRLAGFGILWFFITLLVESSIIPIADVYFEHRLYLPIAGLCMAMSVLALTAMGKLNQRILLGIVGSVILLLTIVTWQRNTVWESEISLWSDVVEKAPDNVRGHFILGTAYFKTDRFDEALVELESALAVSKNYDFIDPSYVSVMNDYAGAIYIKKGMLDKALERVQTAIKLDDLNFNAHSNLALILGRKGQFDQSIEQSLIALRLNPDFAEPHKNLGTAYLAKGMLPQAETHLERAVTLDPNLAEAYNNLGIANLQMGKIEKAVERFQAALRLKPDNTDFKFNLAEALEKQRKR